MQKTMIKYLVLVLFMFFNVLEVHSQDVPKTQTKVGVATYYHPKFEGRKTTNGERYRGRLLTAAHRTLPFGTIVQITNLANGRIVRVRINDRGPFVKKFVLDLSESAAKELGFFGKGITKISYEILT